MLAASVASAQALKAEIPFAFQAGGKTMAPGSYRIDYASSLQQVIRLDNQDARSAVLVLPESRQDAPKAWAASGKPMASFACNDAGCELAQLWTASGRPAYTFKSHRPKNEETRMAYIVLHKGNGE